MRPPSAFRLYIGRILRSRFPFFVRMLRCTRRWWLLRRLEPKITLLGFYFAAVGNRRWGEHEKKEIEFILSFMRDIDVFIDVGANIGIYSILARSQGKHVLAFEPLHTNLQVLIRNLQANGFNDVEVWPMGLSKAPGVATIFGEATGASLLDDWGGGSAGEKTKVALTTLDIALSQRFLGQRMFIKIDVEGTELNVIQGGRQVLMMTPRPVWLVEICLQQHRPEPNRSFLATFEEFWKCGYQAYRLEVETCLTPVERVEIEEYVRREYCEAHNWIFLEKTQICDAAET